MLKACGAINKLNITCTVTVAMLFLGCSQNKVNYNDADTLTDSSKQQVDLPAPYQTKSVRNYCTVIGWPQGKTPIAPPGFKVSLYAGGLDNPRNIYVAKNGDIFVSEANTEIKGLEKIGAAIIGATRSEDLNKSANNIILFRDTNGDGIPDTKSVFLSGLNQPFGMLILGNWFYVANTDGLWRYPYKAGQTHITAPGQRILILPAGGYNNHWTRNLRANADSSKIYVSVGSGTNDAEHGMANEIRRADVLEINPDGSGERVYANGLRNPAGIDFQPQTHVLWAAVNERDTFGDNLVPDYLTSVKEGGFYGWPYAYFGQHPDPKHKGERPDMVKRSIVPDFALGSHTASLGLAFYTDKKFPEKYWGGAFIGQHGSWNSSKLVGYKVTFIPFVNGKPTPQMEDFLTGFIADSVQQKVYGRPVGIAIAKDGSLLVADDSGNKIWRVKAL
jgi:glucose/arabinose dehydrogenase